MLYHFRILEESLSKYNEKENICMYHSFYIYLKIYYPNIIDLEKYLNLLEKRDLFCSIEEFIEDFKILKKELILIHPDIKEILNNIILGIYKKYDDTKVELIGYLDINEKKLINKINKNNKLILLLNDNEHFEPIILL